MTYQKFQKVLNVFFSTVRNFYIHIFIIEQSPILLLPRSVLLHYEKNKYIYYFIFAILLFTVYLLNLQVCYAMTLAESQEIVNSYTKSQTYLAPRLPVYQASIIRAGWFLNKNHDVLNVLSKDPDFKNYNSRGKLRLFSNLITRLAKSLSLHKDNMVRVVINQNLSPNEQFRRSVNVGNYYNWCNWVLYHHTLPQSR